MNEDVLINAAIILQWSTCKISEKLSQSSNNNLNLRIFDTCGKLILAKLIPPGINKISFIDYSMAEGLFYYELSTEDMLTQRGKIVVVRKWNSCALNWCFIVY